MLINKRQMTLNVTHNINRTIFYFSDMFSTIISRALQQHQQQLKCICSRQYTKPTLFPRKEKSVRT